MENNILQSISQAISFIIRRQTVDAQYCLQWSLATEFQNRRPEKEKITTERFVANKGTKNKNKTDNTEQANKPKTTEKHSIASDHIQQPY